MRWLGISSLQHEPADPSTSGVWGFAGPGFRSHWDRSEAKSLVLKSPEKHPPALPAVPNATHEVGVGGSNAVPQRATEECLWYVQISWACTSWENDDINGLKKKCVVRNRHHNSNTMKLKLRKNNDTMHCTEGGNLKLPFSPRECISKYGNRKKRRPVNSQRAKTRETLCPSDRAHYLDPRGKRRCSSTKALALHKHN